MFFKVDGSHQTPASCGRLFLLACAIVIGVQFLYVAGQVYHAATMAYKGGGFMPHMISFGSLGVLLYLVAAIAMAVGLWVFIKLRGGVRNAKMAMLLLIFLLVNTVAFVGLIVMPYSDVVSRF
jgi:hypothetical protein